MSYQTVLNLEQKLAQLQESWDAAPVEGEVPEGDYEGEVTDFDFFESHQGELFLKTVVTVHIPTEYRGTELEIINSLSHPDRIRYAKELIARLGLDVQNLSMGELIPALRTVQGAGVACRVVHNTKGGKKYQNVYLNDLLFAPGEGVASASDAAPDMAGLPHENGAPTSPGFDPDLGF